MDQQDPLIINEAQLILADKRTHLATLRTSIAVLALPLTVVSFLIAASKYYHISEVIWLLAPLLLACLGLLGLGTYLVWRSLGRLRHAEAVLNELKRRHSVLSEIME